MSRTFKCSILNIIYNILVIMYNGAMKDFDIRPILIYSNIVWELEFDSVEMLF